MELQIIGGDFSVCKVADCAQVDFTRAFVFVAKTDEEVSLVCETACVPPNALAHEAGWRALRVSGVLDFGMVGVIAQISAVLAAAHISVFVVSTYNTDYVLMKAGDFDRGVQALYGQKIFEAR